MAQRSDRRPDLFQVAEAAGTSGQVGFEAPPPPGGQRLFEVIGDKPQNLAGSLPIGLGEIRLASFPLVPHVT